MLERLHKGEHPNAGRHPQTLRDFLSVPYVLESKAIECADGTWRRHVSYPELPGCIAEAVIIEDAIRVLERRRIEIIVRTLREGRQPPCPDFPLPGCDPEWIAVEAGIGPAIRELLDLSINSLKSMPDPFADAHNK